MVWILDILYFTVIMDGSLGYFRAGQQRKSDRVKSKGKFDSSNNQYKVGKSIASTKELSKEEKELLINQLKQSNRKDKSKKLILFGLLLFLMLIIFVLLFYNF